MVASLTLVGCDRLDGLPAREALLLGCDQVDAEPADGRRGALE